MDNYTLKLIIILSVGAALIMVGVFLVYRRKLSDIRAEQAKKIIHCIAYPAIVMNIDEDKNPVLMFRDEDKKATYVHKYKSVGLHKYEINEKLTVLYDDAGEICIVPDDCDDFLKMFNLTKWGIIAIFAVPILLLTAILIILL
ncbi:MAG: hypothetical protein LBM87_08490 [Ruminococcus sp.]|jgi:hypothetical protein|nr:hypothetical protein [Ruminococcus sp.]